MNEPGERARWASKVNEPGERARWASQESEPGERARWTSQVSEPGERARWARQVSEPGERARWARQVSEAGEQARWASQVSEPGNEPGKRARWASRVSETGERAGWVSQVSEPGKFAISIASCEMMPEKTFRFFGFIFLGNFGFPVFLILLTLWTYLKYLICYLIPSFMVLSVYFILWAVLLFQHSGVFFIFFITHLREKCTKQKIAHVYCQQISFLGFYVKRTENDLKIKICFQPVPLERALLNCHVFAIQTFLTHQRLMRFKNIYIYKINIMRTN